MTQIVYENVDIIDLKDERWTILARIELAEDSYIKIADFDTFLSMNGKHESQVVQNAIEQGQFRSVNKIRKPDTCLIELAKGGNVQDIELVLSNLKKYKDSTDLLTVRTPFGIMEDMNLIGLDYIFRQGESAYMLVVKLTLQEIQSGDLGLEYTTAVVKDPQNTNTQKTGEKQPKKE